MKIFFTSDTHFGHGNIIKYCNRPFVDKVEMDRVLIENWNAVVGPQDRIYHLGDFAFLKQDQMRDVLKKLNGEKILIRGNHDKSKSVMLSVGFDQVYDALQIDINGETLWMSHYPYPYIEYDPYIEDHDDPDAHHEIMADHGQPKDNGHTWLLCGHVHTAWKSKQWKDRKSGMLNVGVDQWGYKPISIDQVAEEIRRLRSLT